MGVQFSATPKKYNADSEVSEAGIFRALTTLVIG
jgi:hypothetical protein